MVDLLQLKFSSVYFATLHILHSTASKKKLDTWQGSPEESMGLIGPGPTVRRKST